MYEDLLALPTEENLDASAQLAEDAPQLALQTVAEAVGRLCHNGVDAQAPLHQVLIGRLQGMIASLEGGGTAMGLHSITKNIPLSIVTEKEWLALVQCSVRIGHFLCVANIHSTRYTAGLARLDIR